MLHLQSPFSKKRPLEAIKIAAYFFKKLKKSQVNATDIPSTVVRILEEEGDQLIRVLGYLLLGIVRIYSKKVEYLLYDCQEVLVEINNFVVHTKEDSARETLRAPYFSVTRPETYDLDAFDVDVLDDGFDENVLPIEEITLKESSSENVGTKQHAFDLCLCEDIAGSFNPCSPMHTPFEDILSTYGIDVNMRKLLNIDGLTTTMEVIQEHGFSHRQQLNRVVLSPTREDCQNVYITQNRESQNFMQNSKVTEILSMKKVMVQYSEESDVNLVKPMEAEVQANGEDSQVDRDESIVPESEQMGHEICQVDSQEPEIEKLLVEDSQVDRDKSAGTEPEQMGNKIGQVNHQEPEIEILRVYTRSRVKSVNRSAFSVPKETQEPVSSCSAENPKDQEIIAEIPDNGESPTNGTRENNLRSEKKSTPDIEIQNTSGVGHTGSQLAGIATPALKERARNSRKRKCLIDEATYLPNKVLKEMIHDATDLVSKRRKVAHSLLDVWRASRSFPRHFFDPVLTGISPELRSLFYREKFKMPKLSTEAMAPPEKLEVTNIAISGLSESIGISPATSICCLDNKSEQIINIAPETPVRQQSTFTRAFDVPMSPGTPNCESVRPFMSDSPRLEPSSLSFDLQPDLINLTDEVVSSYPGDSSEWDGWSVRTRAVALYFRGVFRKLKEREEEELNLSMAVEGKSKKESARLFFEVLVLSSKGFVGVKQKDSYGDISVSKLEKFDQSLGLEE